jgi:hypothetical protein
MYNNNLDHRRIDRLWELIEERKREIGIDDDSLYLRAVDTMQGIEKATGVQVPWRDRDRLICELMQRFKTAPLPRGA